MSKTGHTAVNPEGSSEGVHTEERAEVSSSASKGRPARIQLRRTKGWRMPPNTVKVDRSTRWGNPFSRAVLTEHGLCGCPNCQVVTFEHELTDEGRALIRDKLGGKNLACWCPLDRMCHADILLSIANGHEPYLPADGPKGQDETPEPTPGMNP